MNRCPSSHSGHYVPQSGLMYGLIAVVLAASSHYASAQTVGRPIPPQARVGTLEVTQPPNVLLNGHVDRLSPGARIRGANNIQVLSGSLVGQPLVVRYLREPQGQIHEVWILTDAEAQKAHSATP